MYCKTKKKIKIKTTNNKITIFIVSPNNYILIILVPTNPPPIRIVNSSGYNSSTGQLQYNFFGIWGSVCDDVVQQGGDSDHPIGVTSLVNLVCKQLYPDKRYGIMILILLLILLLALL